MKKHYSILAICIMSVIFSFNTEAQLVFDQVDITSLQDQDRLPSSTIQTIYQYYLDNQYKTPSETELRDMPRTTTVPSNMEEIYYSHVWLNIAQYCWLDGDHYADAEQSSVALLIPDRQHGTLRMLFDNLRDNVRQVIDARAQGTFDEHPVVVSKVKNNYYFVEQTSQNKEQASYHSIVNYRDGLLIYENTSSAKPGDFNSFRRYRFAAIGIPKKLLEETNATNMPVIHTNLALMYYDTKSYEWKNHIKRSAGSSHDSATNQPNYNQKPVVEEDELDFEEDYEPYESQAKPQVAICAKPSVIGEMLSEAELKSLRPGMHLNNGLEDALFKFDWLEIGGLVWYNGEEYWGNSTAAPLYRFQREGGIQEYEIHVSDAGKKSPRLVTKHSDDTFQVVKRGNFTFITNGKEGSTRIEYTVLRYDGNILVFDEFDAISGIRVRKFCKATPRVK